MKTNNHLILVFFLALSVYSFGQYKHYSIGAFYGTNDLSENFNSGGINLQYNTKNTLSFRTGLFIDNFRKVESNTVKSHPVDHYVYHEYKNEISTVHYSIPLLARVSIGKTVYFTLSAGGVYSGLATKPYVKTTTYLTDWQNNVFDKQVDYSEGKVTTDYKGEFNAYFGAGVCWPLPSGITFNLEASGIQRLKKTDDSYSVFKGIRLQAGISYQLNFRKESKYSFSSYSLKVLKTTGGE